MDVISHVVLTTYQANAKVQPTYQMQFVEDVANLPFAIRQPFAAFHFSWKEVQPKFGHERQEREPVYSYWGVDAYDLEFGSPSISPEEEVTNNYPPDNGLPLGENWPNSEHEPVEVLVPETPEQSMPTNFQQRQFSLRVVKVCDFFRLLVEIGYEKL